MNDRPDKETADRPATIRRMKYLARRRSTLELETMLGAVIDRIDWGALSGPDIDDLARILESDDRVLEMALFGRGPAPEGARPELWTRILRILDHVRAEAAISG
ncbi:MAG: succinate dehydrogenase assembly factor 2 [Proteobacteria bacterium]|nr:succinate dehydrogenase assembly factor 2 [Pseudomonadota bacterium]